MSTSPRRKNRRVPAFTLIEATISIVLVGVILLGALSALGATAGMRRTRVDRTLGRSLARELLGEIVALAYAEPTDASTPGVPEPGETGGTRAKFDDVDDYAGWSESPPADREGSTVPGATGWTRSVRVVHVRAADLAPSGAETGLKRIDVTAISPTGVETTLTALRADSGPGELALNDVTFTSRVDVAVNAGGSKDLRRSASVALVNRPPAIGMSIVLNGDFENGVDYWPADGSCTVTSETDVVHEGAGSLSCTSRAFPHSGPVHDLTPRIRNGGAYDFTLWVRPTLGFGTFKVSVDVVSTDGSTSTSFSQAAFGPAWMQISGDLTPSWSGTIQSATLRVESPTAVQDFYIDDVIMVEVQP